MKYNYDKNKETLTVDVTGDRGIMDEDTDDICLLCGTAVSTPHALMCDDCSDWLNMEGGYSEG